MWQRGVEALARTKKGLRHNEEQRKLLEKAKEEPFLRPISSIKQMLRQMAVNYQKMGEEEMRQCIRGWGERT